MTPAQDKIALQHAITAALNLAHLDALCHDLSVREVLALWALGKSVTDQNACLSRLGRLGRG